MASHQYPEQRKIIKFWCELGYSPTKTYEMKKNNNSHLQERMYQEHTFLNGIGEGRKSLEDDAREGLRRLLKQRCHSQRQACKHRRCLRCYWI
jgi:hypothetical protein